MKARSLVRPFALRLALIFAAATLTATGRAAAHDYFSPAALLPNADGTRLYVAGATAREVVAFEVAAQKVTRRVTVPGEPRALTLSADGALLFVAGAAPASVLCVVETASFRVKERIAAGHTASALALSPDEKTLFVCNRFSSDVSVIDLAARKEVKRIAVVREPTSVAVTKDAKHLLVANHLHAGRADADVVSAVISVIEIASGKVVKELSLPNGSGLLRDLRISPDGKTAAVVHNLARFHLPTTQLERGWMNTSALTLIDLAQMKVINTVLVDNVDSGAANPWGVTWTPDSRWICVTHAGTCELSVIDAPGLLAKLAKMPEKEQPGQKYDYSSASRIAADVPNDLAFLVGLRKRLRLPGHGQRAVALIGNQAWVANYFSDSLTQLEFNAEYPKPKEIPLGARQEMSIVRRGEMLFNDATICFQGWQSCASCHSEDARVDGLNWDLLNDGIGNPKNNKSLLLAHKTPPAMSIGVRETAETAVRAGIKHILFTVQPEEVPVALDEYLKSLQPIPSPYLVNGKPSAAAERGKRLFNDDQLGCVQCHPTGLFTDLKSHEVGTRGPYDKPTEIFDTPTLIEAWRTGPYLHDGSAATLREVVTSANKQERHGKTGHLAPNQIDDLVAYLLSL